MNGRGRSKAKRGRLQLGHVLDPESESGHAPIPVFVSLDEAASGIEHVRTARVEDCQNFSLDELKDVLRDRFQLTGLFELETTGEAINFEIHTNEELRDVLKKSDDCCCLKLVPVQLGPISPDSKLELNLNLFRARLTQFTMLHRARSAKDKFDPEDGDTLETELKLILPSDRNKVTLSFLEDYMSAYRINWGGWKVEHGNKTIEDLFDELQRELCELCVDEKGLVRVVKLVRVKVVQPTSGEILVNALKMVDKKRTHSNVHSLPAYKCRLRGDLSYNVGLSNLQQELGYAIWGKVNILEMVNPTGFERPTCEVQNSKSFPGLRTHYHVDTLRVEMLCQSMPMEGSFTTADQLRPEVTRLWQWMPEKLVQTRILRQTEEEFAVAAHHSQFEESNGDASGSLVSRILSFLMSNSERTIEQSNQKPENVEHFLEDAPDIFDHATLKVWLQSHGIDTSRWGTGEAKSVANLLDEIQKGEANLVVKRPKNQVLRVIRVAKVEVVHPRNPNVVLVESHQIMADGRLRVRFKTLSEKFKPGETPREAAIRGVREELLEPEMYLSSDDGSRETVAAEGFAGKIEVVSIHAPTTETMQSPSYPSLETRYILHKFRCIVEGLPLGPFCTDERSRKGLMTHFWKWESRESIKVMNDSLIAKVKHYFSLVPSGRDMNILEEWLFEAAKQDEVEVIELLRREESFVDVTKLNDRYGQSLLRVAALHNSHRSVKALVQIHLECAENALEESEECNPHETEFRVVNQPDKFECTLIYYASVTNNAEVVKQLLASKSVDVNSVCLHSCISRRAVNVLPLLLPRLRLSREDNKGLRHIFGQSEMVPRPKADSFSFFKSLVEFIDREIHSAGGRMIETLPQSAEESVDDIIGGNLHDAADENTAIEEVLPGDGLTLRIRPELKALEILLQFCNPTAFFFKIYLKTYLQNVIEVDHRETEERVFRKFVTRSRFPLHMCLLCAHVLRTSVGLNKRFIYLEHAQNFEKLACEILDCCDDIGEANQLLRERADIPAWRREDGTLVRRPWASRHKATCAYLAVKFRMKDLVAHKFFPTQNEATWFNTRDSLYVHGLGRLNDVSASLFQFDDESLTTFLGKRSQMDRKTRGEGLVTFLLRLPGLKFALQGIYRLVVSFLLLGLLVLMTPLLWVIPFSLQMRRAVDLPRTEFASCYFKWSVWSISHLAYLVSFAHLAITRNGETTLLVFVLGNFVGVIEQILSIGFGPFTLHSVNIVDTGCLLLVGAAFAVRETMSEEEGRKVFDILMSLGALLSGFRLFHLFSAFTELGTLWITIQYVAWDVMRFMLLLGVVMLSFVLAFGFLLTGRDLQGFETSAGTFSSLTWSIFEPFTTYDPTSGDSMLFQLLLFGFLLLASLLLTNLLIAMMTDRHTLIQQTARIESLFSLAQVIDKYTNMPLLPPPFNLLVFLPNIIFRIFFGRMSLYDPDSFQNDKEPLTQRKRRKSVVVPEMSKAFSSQDLENVEASEVNRDEMQTLNFRSTRRGVILRFLRKCNLHDAKEREIKDALAKLDKDLEQCRNLIIQQRKTLTGRTKSHR